MAQELIDSRRELAELKAAEIRMPCPEGYAWTGDIREGQRGEYIYTDGIPIRIMGEHGTVHSYPILRKLDTPAPDRSAAEKYTQHLTEMQLRAQLNEAMDILCDISDICFRCGCTARLEFTHKIEALKEQVNHA